MKKTANKNFGLIILAIVLVFTMLTIGCDGNGDDNGNKTPIADDYIFGNRNQTAGNVTAVTITAKDGKSPGAVSNIRYNNNIAIPQTEGTYAVTFDVAAATGWNAAAGLSAGTLVVSENEITGNIIVYPFPSGMPKFTTVSLKAEGTTIDLYSVKVNNIYLDYSNAQNDRDTIPVAMFDMKGSIEIEITVPSNATDVIIRPISSNITPVVNGRTISFTITEPNQYSVEYNNTSSNPKNAVLIFANQYETFTGTTVVEPGIHTQNYTINSGQTLYLKPGAVVRGKIIMNSNSKVVGRGIIDGSHLQNWKDLGWNATLPIETYGSNNLEIKGITIFDPNAWNIQIQNASNVKISNVKIVASRYNSDGISIQSSNNVTIENCFIRTWDDGITVKNYGQLDSHTITVKNCRIWTDLAQSLEIGFETNKGSKSNPKIYNVTFEDIEIFHALHKAPISIHNGDNADIFNITFKNIVIENYQSGAEVGRNGWNYIIDITNLTSVSMGGAPDWTTVTARGSIRDVLVEDVKIISGKSPTARFDSNEGGSITVSVKNIFNGATKLNLSSYAGTNATVNNL
jgi:hypothetical protein